MKPDCNRSPQEAHVMTTPMIANLEKLLDGPRDGAVLRLSLGNAWLPLDAARAAGYYRDAVARDAAYSAAWKGLGRALAAAGEPREALEAWRQGIAVAEQKGDIQAAREMKVFLRRLEKTLAAPDGSGEAPV
jgi:tetratricopeptide (TPR) repeat protein